MQFGRAPSSLGDPFVYRLSATDADAVDEAFGAPPKAEEQGLDPFRDLNADPPMLPSPPAAPPGTEVVARGEVGAAGWLAVLGKWIDPQLAFDAVEGLGGDAYTLARGTQGTCADIVIIGDERMAAAAAACNAIA